MYGFDYRDDAIRQAENDKQIKETTKILIYGFILFVLFVGLTARFG